MIFWKMPAALTGATFMPAHDARPETPIFRRLAAGAEFIIRNA